MSKVLITGGTGLVGKHLTQMLKEKNYKVNILSRDSEITNDSVFYWDYSKNKIDENVFNNLDYIIHLAGENIGSDRWSDKRKKQIVESRVNTTEFLFNQIKQRKVLLKAFVSASATGYYGAITSEEIFTEKSINANDFLGVTCKRWEDSVNKFNEIGIRTITLRTGLVLAQNGGALAKMIKPIELGFGATLGNGKQYMPWVHIDDLCNFYIKSIEDDTVSGVYNIVSPEHITNQEFTKMLTKVLSKNLWLPNVPASFLKLIFGEMSDIILKGSRVSSEKVVKSGFKFKYINLEEALKSLINDEKK